MSTSRILSVESWTLRIFWPHYLGKYRTVGTCVLLRNHGRVTASRRTEKTVDTRHLRVDWLRIHSAKGDVTRSIGTARTLYSDLNALIYDTLIQYQQNYCVMIMILHGLVKFIKIARYHITINLQNNVIQSSVRHAHLQQHTRDFRWSLLTYNDSWRSQHDQRDYFSSSQVFIHASISFPCFQSLPVLFHSAHFTRQFCSLFMPCTAFLIQPTTDVLLSKYNNYTTPSSLLRQLLHIAQGQDGWSRDMKMCTFLPVATDFSFEFDALPTTGGRTSFLTLGSSLTPVCCRSEARAKKDMLPGTLILWTGVVSLIGTWTSTRAVAFTSL